MASIVLPFRSQPSKTLGRALPRESSGFPRGRVIEVASSGADSAGASAAVQILLACQREGDSVAWIQPRGGSLYPPDLHAAGLDLDALAVVHVPPEAGGVGLAKAAELLLRTGAFGGVALDFSLVRPPRGEAWLGRLAALAREHDARSVLLSPATSSASLGAMVSLRIKPRRRRVRPGRYQVEIEVLKNKAGVAPSFPSEWLAPEGVP
jgi:recombination protein RecA